MATRILQIDGEEILNTEYLVVHASAVTLAVYLPVIGDGTGESVKAGTRIILGVTGVGFLEVLNNKGQVVKRLGPQGRTMAIAVDASSQMWETDSISVPVVADSAARDALFPTPVGGEKVFRLDVLALDLYIVGTGWTLVTANPTKVPTLEELQRPAPSIPNPISATTTVKIGPTNFNERIGALTLSFSAAIAKSDTDYWTLELQRIRNNGTPVRLTAITTQNTGGVAIAANTPFNFDNAIWPASLRYLLKGDILQLVFTKTGVPANLADACATIRYEPNVVALVRDTFTRADSSTSAGSTEDATPKAWQILPLGTGNAAPVFGIKTNALAMITPSSVRSYLCVDAGVADCSVSATVADATGGGGYGLAMCMVPSSNGTVPPSGYINTQNALFRGDAGTLTSIVAISPALATGDTVTIERTQGVFRVYKNGVLVATSGIDNTYQGTLHGVRYSSGTNNVPMWDDFVIGV